MNEIMKFCAEMTRAVLLLSACLYTDALFAGQPDLVLFISVDQLRGDMPLRYQDRFGPGGFRYLMDNGVIFTNARLEYLVTTTAPGHATLATGGNIPQHGIAGNNWYDNQARKKVYNTEDESQSLVGEPAAAGEGRSPKNLTSTTFGDELVKATAGKSRVFAVSGKDRSAIILGGHQGKAFWYSKLSGNFISSSYYYEEYPDWVKRWNGSHAADRFRNANWSLLADRQSYLHKDQDDRWFEKPPGRLGRTFPHPLNNPNDKAYYSTLRETPIADQLILAFLEQLVESEKPGQGESTDVLAVSFSATDYIGHAFGPNSLEAEDNLLRLDRTLAELFRLIDQKVGLDQTLVVLSADHGVSPSPEFMQALGYPAARHDPPAMMSRINTALQNRFNIKQELAIAYWTPGIYLDPDAVEALGLDLADVERAVSEEVLKLPGFTHAFTRSDLLSGNLPHTEMARLALNSFHPVRSANVLLVQDPFWYLAGEPDGDVAMHGSPYNYDRHVPIMMAGPGVGHASFNRRVAPRDIAPTITDYLGIETPSGSVGTPLPLR